jgi:PhzF family phenazine biosynthesis protein
MTHRPCQVVDVFSAKPFLGNPVAVVLDGAGLSGEEMQAIARWTNLSETTFVLPPTQNGADYLLRIFTPRSELPFAGHPTLGSLHALTEAGLVSTGARVVQQCGVGLVSVERVAAGSHARYRLALPAAKTSQLAAAAVEDIAAAIGLSVLAEPIPLVVDVGPKWLVAQVESVAALLAARPNYTLLAALERQHHITGVTLYAVAQQQLETRSFAPSQGVDEDPVCGSGNGAVAVHRLKSGQLHAGTGYLAEQGRCLGRAGRVLIDTTAAGDVWLGGDCVTTLSGHLLTG